MSEQLVATALGALAMLGGVLLAWVRTRPDTDETVTAALIRLKYGGERR